MSDTTQDGIAKAIKQHMDLVGLGSTDDTIASVAGAISPLFAELQSQLDEWQKVTLELKAIYQRGGAKVPPHIQDRFDTLLAKGEQ